MKQKIVVCTISAEGTAARNRMMLLAAKKLKKEGCYHVCSYGGKANTQFGKTLKNTVDIFLEHDEPDVGQQMHDALVVAAKTVSHDGVVVYMEGDKHTFIPHIPELVKPIQTTEVQTVLATRSLKGFFSFPISQVIVESVYNFFASVLLWKCADYLYGPKAFTAKAAKSVMERKKLGWGTVIYPFAYTRSIACVPVKGYPQPAYKKKYEQQNFFSQLGWRIHQEKSNFKGLFAGMMDRIRKL